MFSTFVCLCVSDGCTREMLLVRESESLCAVYPRKFESRLPGQDTCEGAVAVKIIHPEPGQPSSNSQAGPVTPYQQAGTVQASLTSPGRPHLWGKISGLNICSGSIISNIWRCTGGEMNSPSCTATHMYQHARDSFYTAARPAWRLPVLARHTGETWQAAGGQSCHWTWTRPRIHSQLCQPGLVFVIANAHCTSQYALCVLHFPPSPRCCKAMENRWQTVRHIHG